MQLSDFRCQARLRVRWAEVDMQRIVFNAHYLMYIDTAMMDYWRALALPYEASMEHLGGDMYVKKATLEYNASAREGDSLTVGLRCARVGNSSCQFLAGIFRGEQLLVSGELIYVYANPTTQRPLPVPPDLRALFEAFEGGDDVTQLNVGSGADIGPAAKALLDEVLLEQGLTSVPQQVADDAGTVHAMVSNRFGHVVATGRVKQQSAGVSRIAGMAVQRTVRGAGLGRQVLEALVQAAQQRGDTSVVVDATAGTQAFYERAGFSVCGARFEASGIAQIPMQRALFAR